MYILIFLPLTPVGLSKVGLDLRLNQNLGDVILDTRELNHTLILVVLPLLRRHCQVGAFLEGSVIVLEDLSMLHISMLFLSVFLPEHHDSTGVETCRVAGHWRGGGLLEQRH